MADKLMYITNNNTQKYPFYRLKLVVDQPNIIHKKDPKVVEPNNKKTLLRDFVD